MWVLLQNPIFNCLEPVPMNGTTIRLIYLDEVSRIQGQEDSRIRIKDISTCILTQKIVLSSRKYDPGCSSRIRILIFYPSRIQGSKTTRSRIPDPDPQHRKKVNCERLNAVRESWGRSWVPTNHSPHGNYISSKLTLFFSSSRVILWFRFRSYLAWSDPDSDRKNRFVLSPDPRQITTFFVQSTCCGSMTFWGGSGSCCFRH
jgi:hypothetical protein